MTGAVQLYLAYKHIALMHVTMQHAVVVQLHEAEQCCCGLLCRQGCLAGLAVDELCDHNCSHVTEVVASSQQARNYPPLQ